MWTLIILYRVICAVAAAWIASAKGRTVVGWAIGGFFLDIIAVIIVACQGNLKEQRAQVERGASERRRLREQLRQERQKTEAFRQYSMTRLDSHDRTLGVDTRSVQALPGPSPDPTQALPGASGPGAEGQLPSGPTYSAVGPLWYYARGGQAQGPVSETELKHLINSSQIDWATMVWTEGLNDWSRLDEIPKFRTE